jgi:signal peptidase II
MRMAAITAGAVLALDQATKLWVVHGLNLKERLAIDVIPPFLNLRMAWNRGVNFGLLAGEADWIRWGLVALALAISAWVWLWVRGQPSRPVVQVSAGLLVGGAIGNVIDRIAYGAVADFLNMSCCGIRNPFAFNIADVAIFAGAIGLVLFAGSSRREPRDKAP